MELLQKLVNTMEFYQKTYPSDACIIVADHEKVIGYLPGETVDLKVIKVGTLLTDFENTVSVQAFRQKKQMREERGSELFGFPYIATATPVFYNGEVIGLISAVALNDKMQHYITETEKKVNELIEQFDDMENYINEIQSISSFVKGIAEKSNLIGINAGIEASRAAEHGRGFSVVAEEVRKMAHSSQDAAKKIESQLGQIKSLISDIVKTAHTLTNRN